MDTKLKSGGVVSSPWAFENMDYPFIAIILRSTPTQNGGTL